MASTMLQIQRDFQEYAEKLMSKRFQIGGEIVTVEKELLGILRVGGVDPNKIDALVGKPHSLGRHENLASFPADGRSCRRTGIQYRYIPGWPTIRGTDVAGHKITALETDDFTLDIGSLDAYDYFGDGSFYLLDAPAVGDQVGRTRIELLLLRSTCRLWRLGGAGYGPNGDNSRCPEAR
ncbi:hypothetical protein MFIFM68171_07147 [Madurella fahalii]|uniref:Uncharacterized protein n=1 Tax=Madurella fahalii TaxID=1157608 RepID=A0ABQ0GGR5_9PEZI